MENIALTFIIISTLTASILALFYEPMFLGIQPGSLPLTRHVRLIA